MITNTLWTGCRETTCSLFCSKNLWISCLNSASAFSSFPQDFHSSFRYPPHHHHDRLKPSLLGHAASHRRTADSSSPSSPQTYHNILDGDNWTRVDCIRHHFNDNWINILRKLVQKILRRKQSTESYNPEITSANGLRASLRHLHSPVWALGWM